MRGDHYDMTPRRVRFERLHQALGYCALLWAEIPEIAIVNNTGGCHS